MSSTANAEPLLLLETLPQALSPGELLAQAEGVKEGSGEALVEPVPKALPEELTQTVPPVLRLRCVEGLGEPLLVWLDVLLALDLRGMK